MSMSRRSFLTSSAAAAGLAGSGLRILGAEQPARTYRTALIGSGWWGNNILGEAMASGACRVTALCDVDRRFLDRTAERVEKEAGQTPKRYTDYRELLEKEKPEICIVATPDHWHALQTIAAVQSGAHVYVEKPISHTILEGRAMVRAARDTGQVVQVGTHRRVSPHCLSARDFIRSGKLGRIGMVRAFVHYGGGPEKPKQNIEPPPELDWDFWCGPAPLRPFNGRIDQPWSGGIHPRGFRHYLDYANGQLGDWGIHWVDQVQWIMEQKSPSYVSSVGGRPVKGPPILTEEEQTTDAPDHQSAQYRFDGFDLVWEHRQFGGNQAEKGENVGCYFYGTEGTLHLGWKEGWTFYPASQKKPEQHVEAQLNQPDQQNIRELWTDFLACIHSGNRPACDIEDIHYSTTSALLGMLSYKLGRGVQWDGDKERCINDPEADRLLRRDYRGDWEYPG